MRIAPARRAGSLRLGQIRYQKRREQRCQSAPVRAIRGHRVRLFWPHRSCRPHRTSAVGVSAALENLWMNALGGCAQERTSGGPATLPSAHGPHPPWARDNDLSAPPASSSLLQL